MAGGLSQIAAEAVLNALLNAAALGAPATWYVGGLTTLPDEGGENYVESGEARVSKTADSTNFPAWSAGAISNGTTIVFSSFSSGETWKGVALFDAATDGDLWAWVDFDEDKAIAAGETLTIGVGALDFSLGVCADGGPSQVAAEAILNALLNGAALGAPATWYVGGFTTLPDANGENYVESAEARTAKTANTTTFPGWASGAIRNGTSIDWAAFSGEETWLGIGLFDDETAGDLWWTFDYTSGVTIAASATHSVPASAASATLGVCAA